ncbi:MAG TPA: hypothetical protein PKO09_04325 [Anaerolineae bacterium]|nr:hypothetical protein [Anaerolineae bacterium]
MSTDLGVALSGQTKVASLVVGPDGLVYGGSGAYSENGHLFRFSAADPGTRTDLGIPLNGSLEAGSLIVLDGKVYGATADQYSIFSYDLALDKLTVEGQVQGALEITSMTAGADGKLYGGDYPGGHVWVFDPATGQGTVLGTPVSGETTVSAVVAGLDGDIYGGTGSIRGQLFRYDVDGQAFEVLGTAVWRDSTVLSLILGSDGQIYGGSGYRRGRVFRLDPLDGGYAPEGTATSISISPRMKDQTYAPGTSEIWALALGSDGMLYASGYAAVGDAKLYRWDPAAGGLMELVGTVPGDNPQVVYDLLPAPDGLVYGGGGDWGGPVLFSYDPASNMLAEIPLDLPSAWHVTALALCPNGLVYGASAGDSGELFSYNPSTGGLAYHGEAVAGETAVENVTCGADNTVYGGTSPTGHLFKFGAFTGFTDLGQPIPGETTVSAVLWASDGMVYGGTAEQGRFFRYDPGSHEVTDLGEPFADDTGIWNLAASPDGLLYGVTGGTEGHLFSFDAGSDELVDLGRAFVYDRFVFGLAVDGAGQTIYMGTGWNYGELVAYERGYRFGWLDLGFGSATPEGTGLRVDVLNTVGEPLLIGVPSGGSLLPISSASTPAIQLRAVLSSDDPASTPELLDWTVHWTEDPVMEISPGELSFFAIAGGPDPSPQVLSLTNPSGGELSWSLTELPGWLQVEPLSGTAPSDVSVEVHSAGLPAGTYAATLLFEGGETCVNCPVEVPVSLTLGYGVFLPLVQLSQ